MSDDDAEAHLKAYLHRFWTGENDIVRKLYASMRAKPLVNSSAQ